PTVQHLRHGQIVALAANRPTSPGFVVDESDDLASSRPMIRTTIVAWSALALSAALAAVAAVLWQRRRHDSTDAPPLQRDSTILDHSSDLTARSEVAVE